MGEKCEDPHSSTKSIWGEKCEDKNINLKANAKEIITCPLGQNQLLKVDGGRNVKTLTCPLGQNQLLKVDGEKCEDPHKEIVTFKCAP